MKLIPRPAHTGSSRRGFLGGLAAAALAGTILDNAWAGGVTGPIIGCVKRCAHPRRARTENWRPSRYVAVQSIPKNAVFFQYFSQEVHLGSLRARRLVKL
jgi:hypothetical protein